MATDVSIVADLASSAAAVAKALIRSCYTNVVIASFIAAPVGCIFFINLFLMMCYIHRNAPNKS
jgi:hypothetical protein